MGGLSRGQTGRAAADHQAAVVETPLANWFLLDSLYQDQCHAGPARQGPVAMAGQIPRCPRRQAGPADRASQPGRPHGTARCSRLVADRRSIANRRRPISTAIRTNGKSRSEKDIHLVNVPATAWLFDAKEPRGWLDITLQKAGADGRDERAGQEARQARRADRVEMASIAARFRCAGGLCPNSVDIRFRSGIIR